MLLASPVVAVFFNGLTGGRERCSGRHDGQAGMGQKGFTGAVIVHRLHTQLARGIFLLMILGTIDAGDFQKVA